MEFHLKRGNTSPSLRAILRDGAGVAVPLAGASIVFSMASQKGVVAISRRAATRDDAVDVGAVRLNWQAGDTTLAGVYNAEFEVTYAGGGIETFPNEGYLVVRVSERLA